jgi:dipeptidyl aminopeptidase/acylaminoacyl peptidase
LHRFAIVVATLALVSRDSNAQPQVTAETYGRAERMLGRNADGLVLRDGIRPNWIAGGDRFWYRVSTPTGPQFVYVDPARRIRRPAFDHARLAAALGGAADTAVRADSLPFQTLEWREEGKTTRIGISLRGRTWHCDLAAYRCSGGDSTKPRNPAELLSPDGRWALSLKDHNLWIRNTATDERRALTGDGIRRFEYAGNSEFNTNFVTAQRLGFPAPPVALWSSDSRRILTHRLDQRGVPESHLIQTVHAGGLRPKLWSFAFPFPGDSLGKATWLIVDAETGKQTIPRTNPIPVGYQPPLAFQLAWWADSAGSKAYYVEHERGVRAYWLKSIDVATGEVRTLAEERGNTLVEPTLMLGTRPNIRVSQDGSEIVWFSQRDGWAHLYLLDGATGRVKNQITKGNWVVRELVRVDEPSRTLWFTASGREAGRDPYYRHLYSIRLDGTGLTLLTPEDAEHEISLSPSGAWAVERYSRADLAPVTVARSLDGKVVVPLEAADLSRLQATGWRFPERFVARAADGVTEIYGLIHRPSSFDSTRKYPVLEEIYPGPQVNKVPKGFVAGGDLRALVELGFVGVEVDGRGTPFRSKAFHDYSYGKLENGGGLEDHVAAFRQLATTRPYLDLDRVGIFGHSGGGFASARAMLLFPEFYKVAVSSAGNHDQRGYIALWGETYHGMPAGDHYAAQANPSIAKNLAGKLLLVFGEMDDNVSPALTLQLIDALTKANKDYDLLIVPNGSHGMSASPYFKRRRWDYFVEHLLGAKPPKGYQIKTAPEYPVGG